MQVAGIDLAWGSRARTGIAVTDEDGRLARSASVITDDEIASFLSGSDPRVIAIDAPIIVTNPTGMRECERDLSRDFRRFHAGTHPTNMSRPSMQPEPRALRLAARHGWGIDPSTTGRVDTPLALEVYPHSSMVGLFGLERVLGYKAKRGRDLASRIEQFDLLFHLMERHCDHPLNLSESLRWQELRQAARSAHNHSRLDLIEDEVDAIFCAYIAWAFAMSPQQLVTYGTASDGAIITFPPPR